MWRQLSLVARPWILESRLLKSLFEVSYLIDCPICIPRACLRRYCQIMNVTIKLKWNHWENRGVLVAWQQIMSPMSARHLVEVIWRVSQVAWPGVHKRRFLVGVLLPQLWSLRLWSLRQPWSSFQTEIRSWFLSLNLIRLWVVNKMLNLQKRAASPTLRSYKSGAVSNWLNFIPRNEERISHLKRIPRTVFVRIAPRSLDQ